MRFSISRLLVLIALVTSAKLMSGCATVDAPATGDQLPTVGDEAAAALGGDTYMVVKDFTPFYTLGPQQSTGPDLSLPQESRVTLIKRSFGFSKVRIDDGREGMVPTEAIAPAPADAPLVQFEEPTSSAIRRVSSSSSGGRQSNYVPPAEFAPLPEEAAPVSPEEVPSFRF